MNRGGAESMIMNLYRKMDKSRVQLDFMVHTEKHCQFDDEIEQMGGLIYHVPRFRVYNFFSYRRVWRRFFQMHPEYQAKTAYCLPSYPQVLQGFLFCVRFSISFRGQDVLQNSH